MFAMYVREREWTGIMRVYECEDVCERETEGENSECIFLCVREQEWKKESKR